MKSTSSELHFLQNIFENSFESVLVLDENGQILMTNPACENLFGYKSGALKGTNLKILIPEKLKNLQEKFNFKNDKPSEKELLGIKKDGTQFGLNLRLNSTILEDETFFIGFIKASKSQKNDLKTLQEANADLIKSKRRFEELISDQIKITKLAEKEAVASKYITSEIAKNFPNGFILVLDKYTEVLFAEGDAIQQLALKDVFYEGNFLEQSPYFSEERKARIKQKIDETLSGEHLSFEIMYKDRYFAVNTAPLRDDEHQITNVLAVYNDISKQKEVEFSIQNALQKEQELNELKSRFISLASHEFRTPLSAILTSAILIGKRNGEGEKEKREKYLAQIERNVQNLTIILNDFLSLGKLDEGKVVAIKERFDLIAYVKSLIKENKINLKKGQSINFNSSFQEIFVNMDAKLLNHILNNLLSNASKYSSETSTIDFKIGKKNENVLLQISDYGIGIPVDDQKYLFDRFFRTKNAANIEGTGLGLNIVKQYTDLMAGTVTFESIENEGTTFWVELPME